MILERWTGWGKATKISGVFCRLLILLNGLPSNPTIKVESICTGIGWLLESRNIISAHAHPMGISIRLWRYNFLLSKIHSQYVPAMFDVTRSVSGDLKSGVSDSSMIVVSSCLL